MKQFLLKPILIAAAALAGPAFAAPAQLHVHGKLGRNVHVSAIFGGDRHHAPRYRAQGHRPRLVVGHRSVRGDHGRRRGHGRHQHGYWKTVHDRVWIPGGYREEYCPPRYGWVYDGCGRRVWGIVDAGGVRRVPLPGHYETRTRRIWVSY